VTRIDLEASIASPSPVNKQNFAWFYASKPQRFVLSLSPKTNVNEAKQEKRLVEMLESVALRFKFDVSIRSRAVVLVYYF